MVSLTVSDEDYMIDKFKADLLYYKGQYELAFENIQKCYQYSSGYSWTGKSSLHHYMMIR